MFQEQHEQRVAAEVVDGRKELVVIAAEKIDADEFRAIRMDWANAFEHPVVKRTWPNPVKTVFKRHGMFDTLQVRCLEQQDLRRTQWFLAGLFRGWRRSRRE